MTFPITPPVLDDFNTGALQNLTARSGWAAGALNAPWPGTAATDAVPTTAVFPANSSNYVTPQATDCEAFCTFASVTPASGEFELHTRITTVGGSLSSYFLRLFGGSVTDFTLAKWVSGSGSLIGADQHVTISAGDSVGLSAVGTTISAWYRSGVGAWVLKDSLTDSSVTGLGFVAGFLNINTSTPALDSVGGGDANVIPGVAVNFLRKGDRRA